ncbi:MAG: M24 family metallopeptidase [Saccharofermentanales bacterium]
MSLPKTELNLRIEAVKKLLNEKNLDLAFVYFDEYNVMNGRYLTGWCPTVERGAVIVARDRDPFLIGGPEAGPYARLESAIKETVSCRVFMVPEEEYPLAEIYDFSQIAAKYLDGLKIKRLGMVGINTVPYLVYSQLAAEIKDAEIVDLTDDYEKLRYVKSEWEISQLRKAFEIAGKSYEALASGIVEGKREYEAAAEAEYVMRKMGSDGLGYRTVVGTAERSIGIIPVYSDRIFKNGEIVITGVAPRYNGYNATACYPVVVGGKPDETQKKWISDVCEALILTKKALRPGISGVEIDSIPRKFLVDKGYSKYMTMPFVHNCGLCEFEKPFFGPSSHDIMQKDQVVCIDISLFNNEYIPGIRVESGYLITEDGCEPLSEYMEKLFENS